MMPSRFKKWLQEKIYPKDGGLELPTSQFPALPSERRRVLTPPASHETSTGAAVAKSAFFQRLPVDVRRCILIEAFGHRTVHMHLAFDHPMVPLTEREMRELGDDGRRLRSPLKRDPKRPKTWQWFGCVCHRDPMYIVTQPDFASEPWMDECVDVPSSNDYPKWSLPMPPKRSLGVMGWLLTCRQA